MSKLKLSVRAVNRLQVVSGLLKLAHKLFLGLQDAERAAIFREFRENGTPVSLLGGALQLDQIVMETAPVNTSGRLFYRRLVLLDVVAEDQLDNLTPEHLVRVADNGDAVGQDHDVLSYPMGGTTAADLLYEMGSEPGFFRLDDEGRSV